MVAFELFGRPVYRYGIFYLISFIIGYAFLYWVPRSSFFAKHKQNYQGLYHALKDDLDDIFIVIMAGVILGGRLGHIVFYEWGHYSQNLLDIFKIHQGGMSFVGGIVGVVLGLLYLYRKFRLSKEEFTFLGDLVLLIVPIGSLLGRIGNSLNQELIGKPLDELSGGVGSALHSLGFSRIYDQVDTVLRVNTNVLQSLLEGGLLLFVVWAIFLASYLHSKTLKPGLIAGVYLIGYGCVRFLVECFKDLPDHELLGIVSISQILSIILIFIGIWLLYVRTKRYQDGST